jgi:hypothetical protein
VSNDNIGFFTKVKLAIWVYFNKKKLQNYLEFMDSHVTIYNHFRQHDDGETTLAVLTSEGELLVSIVIEEGKLDEVRQLYAEEMKPNYYEYYQNRFTIETLMPDDMTSQGYIDAYNLFCELNPEMVKA